MLLTSLAANAHPEGNRIDINWKPATEDAEGIRVVRRRDRYPEHPDDGQIVYDGDISVSSVSDSILEEERTFYYSLFPYAGTPAIFELNIDNRLSAVTTANNGFGDYMRELLPAVYQRYDNDEQLLARFLQLTGGQLDQFYSFTRAMREFTNVQNTPGPLLPLLASWIGWRLDTSKPITQQKDEISDAPSIYQRIGLIPTVESTIKRITGWESRVKEYVHNIFSSNAPGKLNFWSRSRDALGVWQVGDLGEPAENLFSLDWAYEGRATHIRDAYGLEWLFYHTYRNGRWEIWFKHTAAITLPGSIARQLTDGLIANEVLLSLRDSGIIVSATETTITQLETNIWRLSDASDGSEYLVESLADELVIYHVNLSDRFDFSGSQRIVAETENQRYPTAGYSLENFDGDVEQTHLVWLFWSRYDEQESRWSIQFRRRQDARWLAIDDNSGDFSPFTATPFGIEAERSYPFLVNDPTQSNVLWLFWFERLSNGTAWSLCYSQRVHGPQPEDPSAWSAVSSFVISDGDPRDLSASIFSGNIFVSWTGTAQVSNPDIGVGGTVGRRAVRYRFKGDAIFDANWAGDIETFAKDVIDDNHHDAEPFSTFNESESRIELFFASNRGSTGWCIYESFLDETDFATLSWTNAQALTGSQAIQRSPVIVPGFSQQRLLFRSSNAVPYSSDSYRATHTFDQRYQGSYALDSRNVTQITQMGNFEDAVNYSYDTGLEGLRANEDRIARDTAGLFLSTDVASDTEVTNSIQVLRNVLKDFSSISDRFVFIPQTTVHTDYVYDYMRSGIDNPVTIHSAYSESLSETLSSQALEPDQDFSDESETNE